MNRIDTEVLRSAICSIEKPRTYSGAYDIVFFILLSRNSNYEHPFSSLGSSLSSKILNRAKESGSWRVTVNNFST